MVYSEPDLIIHVLKLLKDNLRGVNTTEIRIYLQKTLPLSDKDKELSLTRKGEMKFEQIVRNLKSHNTLTRKGFATYEKGIWKITEKGINFLEENEPIQVSLKEQGFKPDVIEKEFKKNYEGIIIEEGAQEIRSVKQRERSNDLKMIAIEEFKKEHQNKIYCIACGFNFSETYGDYGKDFIIIHHTEPVHEMDIKGSKVKLSEALKKVVPLCSNCHAMVHHRRGKMLSIDELKKIIKH